MPLPVFDDPEVQMMLLDATMQWGTDRAVARATGISRTTIGRMDALSEEGHPALQEVTWGDPPLIAPFHTHRLFALDLFISDTQQELTIASSRGRDVPMVHGGAYQFEDCEFAMSLTEKQFADYLKMDDETREMLGVPKVWWDRKKRVVDLKTGFYERVRATQFIPPSLEQQARVLAAFAPELFGDKRSITLSGSVGLGVTVIGKALQPPQSVIDVTPTPAITDQSEVEFNDTEYKPPEADMTEEFTPDPQSQLTEEQQRILARNRAPANALAADLAARAAAKVEQTAAPVVQKPVQAPPPSSYRNGDQDDTIPRTPRGYKIV